MPYVLCLMPYVLYVSEEEVHDSLYNRVCRMPSALCLMPRYVSEEVHDSLYNPYDFDLMEFVAKNIAARRARGSFP
jgi:hypothetical protein